jgi:hypothetical protein
LRIRVLKDHKLRFRGAKIPSPYPSFSHLSSPKVLCNGCKCATKDTKPKWEKRRPKINPKVF